MAKKPSPRLIVREHLPHKRAVLVALAMLLAIGLAYVAYDYGHSRAGFDYESVRQARDDLQQALTEREQTVASLQERVAVLERAAEIEQQGYHEVDESLRSLQSEILELKEEVAFYRSIVAPRESSRGLRIQRFKITPGREAHAFRYKLVLTQVIKTSRITRGNVEVKIEGLRKGEHQVLALKDIATEKVDKLPFRFRYFQNFEGDLLIPADFTPSRVMVKVVSNRVTLKKTFDWPMFSRPDEPLKTTLR
ncbi:MAG: hypothetical protein PVH46_03535 [Granulosicoccaceae bacterium]|jgi:hypothetical protein